MPDAGKKSFRFEASRVELGRGLTLDGKALDDLRVTANFRNVDAAAAIQAVCEAAGFRCRAENDAFVISSVPMVSVGGSRVPLLGAMSVPGVVAGGGGGQFAVPGVAGTFPFGAFGSIRPTPPSFSGDNILVDLDMKDAPIREAMAELSEASGIKIIVHDAVPKEIKVTARMYEMPLGQVLSLIVDQANLTYTVSYPEREKYRSEIEKGFREGLMDAPGMADLLAKSSQIGKPEVHIVPKPELKVTGPGISSARQAPGVVYGGGSFGGSSSVAP
jgi:hypothetical protein